MNESQRGFHFLIGLAALWLMWRLYAAGVIFQAATYMATGDSFGGPGAILVAFAIEFVITIGWVLTLVVSGIWDALFLAGKFASDGLASAKSYLDGFKKDVPAPTFETEPVEADPVADQPAPVPADPVLAALQQLNTNILTVQSNVAEVADRVKAVEAKDAAN